MGRFVIDLHMHTSRYSPCAPLLEPETIISRLHERGLSGGVITEHDVLWSEDELQALVHASSEGVEGVRLYRGVEISADHAHILAFGLESLAETPRGCPIQRVIDTAQISLSQIFEICLGQRMISDFVVFKVRSFFIDDA